MGTSLSVCDSLSLSTHTHTHKHTYIHTYISNFKKSDNKNVTEICGLSKKFVQWVGGGVGCELVVHPSSSLHSTGPS